jgi:hypothetical protein
MNFDKTRDTSHFCSQYFALTDVIQDEGLIFAEGDRDNLNSDHGKTYCAYLLLKRYLNDSIIFSRYTDIEDIFIEKPKEEVQVKKDVQEAMTTLPPDTEKTSI